MMGIMRNLILFIFLGVFFSSTVDAQTLRNCRTIETGTNVTATQTGTITNQGEPGVYKAMTAIATLNNDSGTAPTADLVLQSCRTTGGTCKDLIAFDQFTTNAVGFDGAGALSQRIDVNRATVNWFKYFRVVSTLGGTSPQYDWTVELCYDS